MPAVDGNNVVRAGGYLIKDPDNLAGTYPEYGGTNLGAVTAMAAQRNAQYGPIVSEERNEVVDHLYLGEAWAITVVLRQPHQDVLGAVFPNTSGSGSSTIVTGRGNFRPGQLLSSKSFKALWVPFDKTNAPALIGYRVVPAPEELAIPFTLLREHTYLVNLVAMPDASGRTVNFGPLAGLSL